LRFGSPLKMSWIMSLAMGSGALLLGSRIERPPKAGVPCRRAGTAHEKGPAPRGPGSYTQLTLPTSDLAYLSVAASALKKNSVVAVSLKKKSKEHGHYPNSI
ncbi:hypothetical protein, partial [Escherichia coli]|uniref:hypothetical protein n=1 Tax=Escherichia coli TaxID=562 RepID=UPI0005C5D91F